MSDSTPTANELGLSGFKDLLDKNFWNRPEGKVGRYLLLGLCGLAVIGTVINILPILTYLAAVAATTTTIIWFVVKIAIAYVLLTNKSLTTLIGTAYRSLIRFVLKGFVDMAPVAVTRDLIRKAYVRIETAAGAIKDFKITMGEIKRTLDGLQAEIGKKEAGARSQLKAKNFDGSQVLQKGAERLRASYERLNKFYQNMEFMCRIAEQMKAKATLKIKGTEENLELQITEYEASVKMKRAVTNLRAAIKPDQVEQDMFNDGVAKMAMEVTQAVVEFDDFITLGQEALADVDLDEATFNEKAAAQIQKWAAESGSSILGPGEIQQIHDVAHDSSQAYDINSPIPSVQEIRKQFNPNDFFSNK